jgi:ATP-dependent Lon protease
VKEKVLAAHRAGLKTVILPRRNEHDLEDVPKDVRKELELVLVDGVDEVLRRALKPAAGKPRPGAAGRKPAGRKKQPAGKPRK